jgi:sulfur relay (sulfurtransferase) DsrF/TusC family protein
MKKFLIFFLLATFSFSSFSQSKSSSDVYVKSYTRSNGTVVKGYYRTAPNSTNRDNFSTRGNVNPYTGKKGYVKPDNKPYSSSVRSNNYSRSSTTSPSNSGKTSTLIADTTIKKDIFKNVAMFTGYYGITKVKPYPSFYRNKPNFDQMIGLSELPINFDGFAEGKMVFYLKSNYYSFSTYKKEWRKSNETWSRNLKTYSYLDGNKSRYSENKTMGGLLKMDASNMVLEDDKHIFIDDGLATFEGEELDIILEKNIILTLKFCATYKEGYYYVLSPSQLKVLSMFNIKEILFRVNREFIDKKTGKLNEKGKIFNYVSKINAENTKELFNN